MTWRLSSLASSDWPRAAVGRWDGASTSSLRPTAAPDAPPSGHRTPVSRPSTVQSSGPGETGRGGRAGGGTGAYGLPGDAAQLLWLDSIHKAARPPPPRRPRGAQPERERRPPPIDCRRLGLPIRFALAVPHVCARVPSFDDPDALWRSVARMAAWSDADRVLRDISQSAAGGARGGAAALAAVKAQAQRLTPDVDVEQWFPSEMVLWTLEHPLPVPLRAGGCPGGGKAAARPRTLAAVLHAHRQPRGARGAWADLLRLLAERALRRFADAGLPLRPGPANKFCAVFAYTYHFAVELYDEWEEVARALDRTAADAREAVGDWDRALHLDYQLHSGLNAALRDSLGLSPGPGPPPPPQRTVFFQLEKWLMAALEDDTITQPYVGTVYRGLPDVPDFVAALEAGRLLHTPQFESASPDAAVARGFGAGTLFVYAVRRRARRLSRGPGRAAVSWFPHEREVLLPPGVPFRVTRTRRRTVDGGPSVWVYCEEVADAEAPVAGAPGDAAAAGAGADAAAEAPERRPLGPAFSRQYSIP